MDPQVPALVPLRLRSRAHPRPGEPGGDPDRRPEQQVLNARPVRSASTSHRTSRTERVAMSADSQKVLVSGSAGFIGGYVVEELLRRGYQVRGIDNYSKY